MYKVLALRKKKSPVIIDSRTNEIIDNGEPKEIVLWQFHDEKAIKRFASNVRGNVKPYEWRIWIEEIVSNKKSQYEKST